MWSGIFTHFLMESYRLFAIEFDLCYGICKLSLSGWRCAFCSPGIRENEWRQNGWQDCVKCLFCIHSVTTWHLVCLCGERYWAPSVKLNVTTWNRPYLFMTYYYIVVLYCCIMKVLLRICVGKMTSVESATWVHISRTHVKPDVVAFICNPSMHLQSQHAFCNPSMHL